MGDHLDIFSFDAYLFDLDGVITPTVDLHRRAWQATFDAYFAEHGHEPYLESDYFNFIDGKPRFEGVRSLLQARGIDADDETVHRIGNGKNDSFTEVLARDGIAAYPGSLRLLDELDARGKRLAVVTSSRNAGPVLAAAGLSDRFEAVVDGNVAASEHLAGKPRPDTYARGAELLGATPSSAVVFEDAASGVAAGRAGDFAVVGVDRGAGHDALLRAGADIVVDDLEELLA